MWLFNSDRLVKLGEAPAENRQSIGALRSWAWEMKQSAAALDGHVAIRRMLRSGSEEEDEKPLQRE